MKIGLLIISPFLLSSCSSKSEYVKTFNLENRPTEVNIRDQQYNNCIDKEEELYNELEENRIEMLRKCILAQECVNSKTMENLITAQESLLKFLEDNKKTCVIKYKR